MNREIDLSVSAYGVTRPLDYDVVILPWGATEPHNLHLPYLTDAILAHDVAVDSASITDMTPSVPSLPIQWHRCIIRVSGNCSFSGELL